jgi:hypothetical protein
LKKSAFRRKGLVKADGEHRDLICAGGDEEQDAPIIPGRHGAKPD